MAQIERPIAERGQESQCSPGDLARTDIDTLSGPARAALFAARAGELRHLATACWRASARTEMLRAAAEWQREADALLYPAFDAI